MPREAPKKRGIIDRIGDAVDNIRGLNVGGAESGRRAKAKVAKKNKYNFRGFVDASSKAGVKVGTPPDPSQGDMEDMIKRGY